MGKGKKDKLPPKKNDNSKSSEQPALQEKVKVKTVEEWPNLDVEDLCRQFDTHISADSENVEGIQAVRDLFINLCVLEKRIEKSSALLRDHQNTLKTEISFYSETHEKDSEETSKRRVQRDRMQALSDELTKKKEKLIETAKNNATDEQNRRQAMNDEFLATIKEISGRLDESSTQRQKHAEENDRLKSALRAALAEYQKVEEKYDSKLQECDKDLTNSTSRFQIQEEIYLKEKAINNSYQEQVQMKSENEIKLRNELASYAERFEKFQVSMNESNEMFVSSKASIEDMTKTIHILETENAELSSKASVSSASLSAAVTTTQNVIAEKYRVRKQIDKLRGLVSVLQSDISKKESQIQRYEEGTCHNDVEDAASDTKEQIKATVERLVDHIEKQSINIDESYTDVNQ
mmetsp:Transcript_27413/g.27646  ORF Transcript_27413/g.27646 Transcript_27413/m.27646 type:complete len:406 (-) Transcript_27413:35-1252(-)